MKSVSKSVKKNSYVFNKFNSLHKIKRTRQSQTGNRLRLAIFSLLLIIVLTFAGKLFNLLTLVRQPITPQSGFNLKPYQWNGSSTLNVVFVLDHNYLVSVVPEDKRLTALKVPDNTYLNLPLGFGNYPINSAYGLGGGRLLKLAMEQMAAVPVDGYIIVNGKFANLSLEQTLLLLKTNPFAILSFLRSVNSDLSYAEGYRLFWLLRVINGNRTQIVDMATSNVTRSTLLADKSRALAIDSVNLDLLIQKQLNDKKIGEETISVGIYNSTKHPRLGEYAARIITNMGGRVVFVNNLSKYYEFSRVVGKRSYTLLRLSQIFAPDCLDSFSIASLLKKSRCAITDPETTSYAQIVLVLGEDFYRSRFSR